MKTKIIPIGNSKGIRIPQSFLLESGIKGPVELSVKYGEIKIVPLEDDPSDNNLADNSIASFAKDWNRTEEEEAWKSYQLDMNEFI